VQHITNASNLGLKSDLVRYEVLYLFGGIYIDIDYECIKSLETLDLNCNFFAGLSNTSGTS
jgi:mannosyltransferase OCH1-like enzyme